MDLNVDMGESFGRYKLGNDEAVMPFITSANVACGFHAGDSLVMQETVRLAKRYEVAVGAHTGLQDLRGFRPEAHGGDPGGAEKRYPLSTGSP